VSAVLSSAQTGTIPEGYFTVNIAAGTGTARTLSNISFPLQGIATASGQMVGTVTAITSNTITNSNAGWIAGQLSQVATPYLLQFTSGAASGRTFLLSTTTANTATTLTLDSSETTDLTTLGIIVGTDTYQIIPADTISSLFGTPATTGILGGSIPSAADQIQLLVGGVWIGYYYNTTSGWLQVGPSIPSGTVVIRPDAAVLYTRLAATPVSLILFGRAPSIARKALVSNSSVTYLSNYWPVGVTLANSKIQNTPGWAGGSVSTADILQIFTSSNVWLQYYYNGTDWMRVGPPINSDNVVIPAGSAVIITKRASSAGQNILTQPLPYTVF